VGEAEDTVSVISQGRIIRDSKDLYERHALRLLAPIMEEAKNMFVSMTSIAGRGSM
jgi:hypothetical protein